VFKSRHVTCYYKLRGRGRLTLWAWWIAHTPHARILGMKKEHRYKILVLPFYLLSVSQAFPIPSPCLRQMGMGRWCLGGGSKGESSEVRDQQQQVHADASCFGAMQSNLKSGYRAIVSNWGGLVRVHLSCTCAQAHASTLGASSGVEWWSGGGRCLLYTLKNPHDDSVLFCDHISMSESASLRWTRRRRR
jgi:hypothetical protein